MVSTHDRNEAETLAQELSNRLRVPAFIVYDGAYHVADQIDLDTYWYDLDALGAVIEEFQPAVVSDAVNWSDRPDRIPEEPDPDDGPGEDTDGIPQGCACCGATNAPILDGGRPVCVPCHLRECEVCASLPRCASCGDPTLETGPRVCPVCIEAGEQCCPVCSGPHYGWQCPEIRLARIELAVMDRLPKYALIVA